MSTQKQADMRTNTVQFLLSILLVVLGGGLMAYMITVESEPGAIPLLLLLLGIGWFFITFFRSRASGK